MRYKNLDVYAQYSQVAQEPTRDASGMSAQEKAGAQRDAQKRASRRSRFFGIPQRG